MSLPIQNIEASSWNLSGFPAFLVSKRVVSKRQIEHLGTLNNAWGGDILKVLVGTDLLREEELAGFLGEYFQLRTVQSAELTLEELVVRDDLLDDYFELSVLPYRRADGSVFVVCSLPTVALEEWARAEFGRVSFGIASKVAISTYLRARFKRHYLETAENRLYRLNPINSAKETLTSAQHAILIAIPTIFAAALAWDFNHVLVASVLALNLYYAFTLLFRGVLTVLGAGSIPETEVSAEDIAKIDPRELPTYTVLVAAYKEAKVLPILLQYLRELDYPRSKLEVKIVLEEDDPESLQAALDLRLESFFEFIVVPTSLPKTKPKALNYALPFARGEFLTIYDAEDRPEADQLLKAVTVFRRLGDVACVQARLNYFNNNENYLTRMFTIEYSQWFDFFLIGLYKLGVPIPLGGTSNHFRTSVLRDLCGWDPYNVTEDADLGIRLEKTGHRVAIVNSTTWEEANLHAGNWVRQRSRWLKGHMQTFLVHMRNPLRLLREIGPVGFFGFTFFIGGPCVVALLNPLLWALVLWASFSDTTVHRDYLPDYVLNIAAFNLIVGNVSFVLFGAVSVAKRRFWWLVPWSIGLPLYWLLQSVAAYKALWQLITNPHYWEKTTHGLTAQTKVDRSKALRALGKEEGQ
ncbi:MAG: glycosyltransferase [Proteobacteria bacterium]|nr:MAG: glycosyltransferase [Pseudomonadota bacterium]